MILQSISRAIREQNYYAVVLEFVIVIAGVVIGFQIQAWNEDRADRETEARYHLRISADLAYDLDRVDYYIAHYAAQTGAAERVIGYHQQSDPVDVAQYHADLLRVLYVEQHQPRYSSLDALLGTGDIALIREEAIINLLLEINLRYEEFAHIQAHKYEDIREYLYVIYGDTLDYAKGIEAWQGSPPPDLSGAVIEDASESLRIKNGLTLVAFNNTLLIEQLRAIRGLIVEAQGYVAEAQR